MDNLISLFNEGKLTQAIEEGNAAVGQNPRDLPLRLVLVQLVCFTGNWDRVEKIAQQLKLLDSDHEHIALTGMIDNLSIGEIQRAAVWNDGMVPEFLETPDEVTNKLLWAASCLRSGEADKHQEALAHVLENAPRVSLKIGDDCYEGFRDLDDLTPTVFEAFTVQGNYVWLPHHLVKSIQVTRPTRLIDHLWNKARILLQDGTSLAMFLPGLYFNSFDDQSSDTLKLGRETVWPETDQVSLASMGRGRRIFGAGEDEFTLFDFEDASLEVQS
jgi:type VI secretion system protein ImpE